MALVDVPNVPGVPAIAFAPAALAAPALMLADTFTYFSGFFGPQWGIFADGFPVVVCDTITAFDYRQEWAISDYPVEEGSFESYDKVSVPFDCRFRLVAGGSLANRQLLLDSVAAIAGDLNVYDFVTPDAVYSSVNIKHYDYRRMSMQGLGMISVDVWGQEIRVGSSVSGSTQSPSGASPVNGGTPQTVAPSNAQVQSFGSAGTSTPLA